MNHIIRKNAAVIVAHPDDELLWAGGTILSRRQWSWHVVSLCRASDADRAPKFHRVLARLGAVGAMGDLDDGPEQNPLDDARVREVVLSPGATGCLPASACGPTRFGPFAHPV